MTWGDPDGKCHCEKCLFKISYYKMQKLCEQIRGKFHNKIATIRESRKNDDIFN